MSARQQGITHRMSGSIPAAPGIRPAGMILLILCLILLVVTPQAAASEVESPGEQNAAPLRIGLLPFTSPVSLFQRFGPLRDYLSLQIQQPFTLESARNFSVHVQRIEAGQFDMVITAPHFVLIALDSGHYELVGKHRDPLYAVFLVHRDDPARGLDDLAQRVIATPPPEALITVVGRDHLLSRFNSPDQAPQFVAYPSHTSAIHAVQSGLAQAAIASINVARTEIEHDIPVRVLGESERFPGTAILLHKRLSEDLRAQIAEIVLTMPDREDGSLVLQLMDYSGYTAATPDAYERFRVMLPETRRHLEPAPGSP